MKDYYYNKNKDKYCVMRRINHRTISFGCFKTEEQAQKAVSLFNELGWDTELRWTVRSMVLD